ncbi:ankyrin repeat domain-containing protein [Mycena rebaudengoi]|nr:ankyrin repeat domain-containing protein [Mycena rebaudengoi]
MADPLSIVSGILQLMSTVNSTISMLSDVANAPKEQRNLFAEVGNLEPLLKSFEGRLQANPSVYGMLGLKDPLAQFKDTMEHANKPGSRIPKALSWTLWNKKEAEEDLVKMERFKALPICGWCWTFGNENKDLVDIRDAGQQQQKNYERTETEHTAEERKKIIEWISLLNFFQRHDDILCARQEGTGLWLLEEAKFKDWVSGAGAIFWCHGMPGAGKTVLSSAVVDYLREKSPSPNIGVACAYLNYKETDMQSPENILAGLWQQLIFAKPILPNYSKVYIVIDALDEYPETKRHALLKHLAALKPNINLLFTSRPHITPEIFFPNTPALEIRATEEDIHRYLDAHIQNSFRLSKHIQSRPELHQEIENQIIGNVDGMFLLAKIHIDSLTTRNTVKAVRQALKSLPIDLEDTYKEAMDRIESQSEEDRNIAKRILIWIANAKRPLSVAELREAIAIERGTKTLDQDGLLDPDIFLSVCAGLVVINHADGSVRFIHYTTQDYMDRLQTSKFPYAQTEITCGCLTYLLYDDFLQLPDSFDELDALVQEHPLLDYSFRYCLVHSVGQPELILRNMILAFLAHASRWLSKFWPLVRLKRDTHSSWDIYNNDFNASTDLLFSALFNLQETAKYLLANDISIRDQHKGQSLIGAAQSGSLGMVQLLISQGANVNAQGRYYGNALQAASQEGHEAVVQLLLNQGADAASVEGHEAVVQLLFNQGANVNAQGGHYGTALQAASVEGHEAVVQLLLNLGANVNAQGGQYGTALQAASVEGHEAVVQLLLNQGANVNVQGGHYGTALQAASVEGHEAVVQLLLNQGANVNVQGGHYGTALQAASVEGHEAVVQLLLNQGANVSAQGGRFGTALQAASRTGDEGVVKLLIDQGADVNAQGGYYGNALQAASYRGHEAVVQLLLNRGADVNAQGGYYEHALQAASVEGHEAVVQLLLNRGADVNAQGGRLGNALQTASFNGNALGGVSGTALQAASYRGHEAVVQLLLNRGADLNAQGGYYGHALQAASYEGHEAVVQLLLNRGADVNAQGGRFWTALQAASTNGHEEVIQLLLANGALPNEDFESEQEGKEE